MAALVATIHVLFCAPKSWMAGINPAMTLREGVKALNPNKHTTVMAAPVAAIHVLLSAPKSWMAGINPAMTRWGIGQSTQTNTQLSWPPSWRPSTSCFPHQVVDGRNKSGHDTLGGLGSQPKQTHHCHGRPCGGHPRLVFHVKIVDGRNKSGHDSSGRYLAPNPNKKGRPKATL